MELLSHQRMLTAIASGMVGAADADDIVQETFLRALVQPPTDTNAPIAPWLVTVARNLAVDLLRHRGRFLERDEGGPEEEAEPAPLPPGPGLPVLLAGLGALTQGEVAVLLLRDGMDLDIDEVSKALETSPGSVRVLHHRARKKAAAPAPLDQGLRALDQFLTWLLGRAVAGLPTVGAPQDPGLAQGVLVAHLSLLDAMIEVAHTHRDGQVEGRARLSRGIARLALGRIGAVEDLELAIALGAERSLAEARLGPLYYSRGEIDRALETVLSALARGDRPRLHPSLHRVAAKVYLARGDKAAAEPHMAALRALTASESSESGSEDAHAAFASAGIAMATERYADARANLLLALSRIRASGNSRNEVSILNNLTVATLSMGELGEAAAWAEETMVLAKRLGARRTEASMLGNLATIAQLEGRLAQAAAGLTQAIALHIENEMHLDAELLRMQVAVVAHQSGRAEQAVLDLAGVVRRLADMHGMSLLPRIQLLAARAELGQADAAEFQALSTEAVAQPSLVRTLALYRSLLERDPAAIDRALAEPSGTAPAERIARSILERIATQRRGAE